MSGAGARNEPVLVGGAVLAGPFGASLLTAVASDRGNQMIAELLQGLAEGALFAVAPDLRFRDAWVGPLHG